MFEAELVRLRGLQRSDLEHLEALEADAETLRLRRSGVVYPGGAAEAEAFWERNRTDEPTRIHFAIEAVDDGRVVGRCVLRDVMRSHRSGELGIALLPAEVGRGFGREALAILVDYALGAMALNRVFGVVRADNDRSLRLFESVGFVREAVFREEALAFDGSRVDVVQLSLLRGDRQEVPA